MSTARAAGTAPRFWNRLAEKYARTPIADMAVYERKLDDVRARLTKETTVLELGCGTGMTAVALAPSAGRYVATDYADAMLDIGRRRAAEAGVDGLEFEQMAVEDLAAREDRPDLVLAMSLLHLLPDHRATIAAVHRILPPGGLFVSSSACIQEMSPFVRMAIPLARAVGKAPFVARFTASQLLDDIRSVGFEIELSRSPERSKTVFVIARKPSDA